MIDVCTKTNAFSFIFCLSPFLFFRIREIFNKWNDGNSYRKYPNFSIWRIRVSIKNSTYNYYASNKSCWCIVMQCRKVYFITTRKYSVYCLRMLNTILDWIELDFSNVVIISCCVISSLWLTYLTLLLFHNILRFLLNFHHLTRK